nr:hypothetical protein [Myxococcales bacterium]
CRRVGRRVLEIPLSAANLREADEVFITSSIREIVPVIQVDSTSIGEGRPGRIVSEIREGFDRYVRDYVSSHEAEARRPSR